MDISTRVTTSQPLITTLHHHLLMTTTTITPTTMNQVTSVIMYFPSLTDRVFKVKAKRHLESSGSDGEVADSLTSLFSTL